MSYVQNTPQEKREMLQAVGMEDCGELFSDVPTEIRLRRNLKLPAPMAEMELLSHVRALSGRNANLDDYVCFRGAGSYDHFIPAVVDALASRGEFATAYTPYQPEASQGMLQAFFEYQTLICQLTGLDVSNASVYDGATAVAEAALMAYNTNKRKVVVVSKGVHPEYRLVLACYLRGSEITVAEIDTKDGLTDLSALNEAVSEDASSIIAQNPNFLGQLEEMEEVGKIAHRSKAAFIASVDPISLGLLKPPGEYGADIAVGEGQSLGNPICFGGPYLGFMACKQQLTRKMPGRIVGQTVDGKGRRGYVLTLQAREQHIRREKATSNICTNQGLLALRATVCLSALGKSGLRQVAELCAQKSHYAYGRICALDGFDPAFSQTNAFFKEFVVKTERDVGQLERRLLDAGMIGGLDLGRFYPELAGCLLFCVTEKRTKQEIDALVEALAEGEV